MLRHTTRIATLSACLAVCLMSFVVATNSFAAEPSKTVKLPPVGMVEIQVEKLHCKTCAKKLARKLYSVPGVMQVKTSVAKNRAYVKIQPKKQVASSKLWAVTQLAGAKPTRLLTSAGEYQPTKAELAAQPTETIKH